MAAPLPQALAVSDVDVAAVRSALVSMPSRAGVRVAVLPTQSGQCALVELEDQAYLTMAMHLLVASWRCDYSGSAIVVSSDTSWYPRTRRSAVDLTADALTLAWCVRVWGEQAAGASGPYAQVWRHVLDCDGHARFGTVEGGECETCALEFPAIAYFVQCSCGLLSLGSVSDPFHVSTETTLSSLADLVVGVDALRREYLARDAVYPSWLPGVSVSRRPRSTSKGRS